MDDDELKYLAVLISTFGIVLLFFVADNLETEVVSISDIEFKDVGKTVKIIGEITSRGGGEGHIFLTVSDGTGEISVPIFKSLARKLSEEQKKTLDEGVRVVVVGEVQEYNGELEVIPRRADDIVV